MNYSNALQGTRMGRRVKTPQEALDEVRSMTVEETPDLVGDLGQTSVVDGGVAQNPEGSKPRSEEPEAITPDSLSKLEVITVPTGWTIDPVAFRGQHFGVRLYNHLLMNPLAQSYECWNNLAKQYFQEGRHIPAAGDIFFAIVNQVYHARNQPGYQFYPQATALLNFIGSSFRDAELIGKQIGLLSRPVYDQGFDSVSHDPFRTLNHLIRGRLCGQDGKLKEIQGGDEYCEMVFDHRNAKNVAHVLENVALHKDLYIIRHECPEQDARARFIGFDMRHNTFSLCTPLSDESTWAMFGIHVTKVYYGGLKS